MNPLKRLLCATAMLGFTASASFAATAVHVTQTASSSLATAADDHHFSHHHHRYHDHGRDYDHRSWRHGHWFYY
jgi:hypothetical protein